MIKAGTIGHVTSEAEHQWAWMDEHAREAGQRYWDWMENGGISAMAEAYEREHEDASPS